MVYAIPAIVSEKAVKLYEQFAVFTRAELESRLEIEYESYIKAINIEARTMLNMAAKSLLPAISRYSGDFARSINEVGKVSELLDLSEEKAVLEKIITLLALARKAYRELELKLDELQSVKDIREKAENSNRILVPAMQELRSHVDELEMLVDKEYWPMPSYGDLIFEI